MQQGFGFQTKLCRDLWQSKNLCYRFPVLHVVGSSWSKSSVASIESSTGGKKTWLQRYSTMMIMEILGLNCWIAMVDCWEISHLLNDSLPSNLDVRQSSKSLTKQAPCARQGVRGHWPISVDQKTAPSPQESEIRWTHQSGRNPTGVKTNSSSRYISWPDTSRGSSNHCGTTHDPFVSLWAIRASVSFPCPVVILFWLLGAPSHGGFHSPPSEAAWIILDPYRDYDS